MTRAVTCPGCQQQIGLADPPEAQENIVLRQELEESKKIPKMQTFIPNFQCKDGTCGQLHENPRYTTRPKGKCNNCDQFSPTKEGKCSWCQEKDSIEEIDKDDLENLGIRLPN